MRSETPDNIVLVTLTFEVGLAVVAVGIGRLTGDLPTRFIAWNLESVAWGLAATLPMLMGLAVCLWIPWSPLVELRRLVELMIRPLFANCAYWQLALIAAAAGFGEELLFRGVLQHYAITWWGVPVGLATASLIFGLAHYLSTAYFVFATLIGGFLGGLWIYFDNLLIPIIAHGVYDFLALGIILRQPGGDRPDENAG